MTRFLQSAVLSAAVAAVTLTAIPSAHAYDNWRYRNYNYNHYHGNGNAVAAGVLGLATGAIIGGLAAQPRYVDPGYGYYGGGGYYGGQPVYQPRYYQPRYAQPRPVYVGRAYEPWSREWYRYCSSRYRSFDPQSGTFIGYDGQQHFCQ